MTEEELEKEAEERARKLEESQTLGVYDNDEDYARNSGWNDGEVVGYEDGFIDGAKFGYNKANEWNTETPSDAVGNKDLLLRVAKDDFDVGYYHFKNKRFYTNDGREVTPLAWKEIHYPQESE